MKNKKKLIILLALVVLIVVIVKVNSHMNTYHLSKENVTEYIKKDARKYTDIDLDYFKRLDVYEDDRYRIVTYRLSDDKYSHVMLKQDFRGKYKVDSYSISDNYFRTPSDKNGSIYEFYIIGNNKFDENITMKAEAGDEIIARKIKPGYFVLKLEVEDVAGAPLKDFIFLNEKNEDVTSAIMYGK